VRLVHRYARRPRLRFYSAEVRRAVLDESVNDGPKLTPLATGGFHGLSQHSW